ncbi:site-specific integrase [Methylovirgula ligni]|uniref:Site-specific recombinase XerD n=1 Tax=Methylovirgula ligni TaxID=569860 RepID=A0A3D9Z498_9HYPH|nr:site-specific integrase [Methylovirgula ligni]QAY95111.1 site-specific integrase [Methylovirgula ligni]REF89605.1 site-specific recombinase XerD [Methylovirgula ligni]
MAIRKRTWATAKGAKEAWISDYVDQSGRRHIKTFERKKDAEAFLARASVEIAEGTHTAASSSVSISEAADLWLESCRQAGLEAATIAAYEQHCRLHIKPYIGRAKLSGLTAPAIRELEDRLRRGDPAPGEEKGHPRSAVMVRRTITNLGALISDAQERGLVARNVVRDVRKLRRRGAEKRHTERHRGKLKIGTDIPSLNEIRAFLAALTGTYRPILMTAVFTGLRASELRGLRWCDVDLKRGEIHVRQRVDFKNSAGPPKSAAGERTVPIPPELANALREHKATLPPARRADHAIVFATGTGAAEYHGNIVKRGLIPAWIAAGVTVPVLDEKGKSAKDENGKPIVTAKYSGLHSLRHFFASWCINRKVDGGLELPAKIVQERLGHSTIAMTLDTYSHLFPRVDDHAEFAAASAALFN